MIKTKIGITGTGSLIGQAIIKSLRASEFKNNVFMVGFDYFKDTIGSFWVDKFFILPDFLKPQVKRKDWLDCIITHIKAQDIRILFIGVDFELELCAEYKDIIESETKCRVMVSDSDVIKIADDKYLTYKFLKNNGLYYPKTYLANEVASGELKYPCFIKPRKGSRSRDTFIVNDKKDLEYLLRRIPNPIVQELIGKPQEEYTCGVIFLDNRVKEGIVLKRDLKDGNTNVAYFSKKTPRIIYDYVFEIANKLKPFGACNFQLRLDYDGCPKVFEINARHSGTTYMRALFGFNEVEYIFSYLLEKNIKKFRLKEGIVKRYYEEVFISSQ